MGNSINTKLSNLKEKISEEVTIDRAWLIIKKNREYINLELRSLFCLDLVYESIQSKKCK